MDWSVHYPKYFAQGASKGDKQVEWADVGCGFGGLLMALAPQFPETLMLGEWVCGWEAGEKGGHFCLQTQAS